MDRAQLGLLLPAAVRAGIATAAARASYQRATTTAKASSSASVSPQRRVLRFPMHGL